MKPTCQSLAMFAFNIFPVLGLNDPMIDFSRPKNYLIKYGNIRSPVFRMVRINAM